MRETPSVLLMRHRLAGKSDRESKAIVENLFRGSLAVGHFQVDSGSGIGHGGGGGMWRRGALLWNRHGRGPLLSLSSWGVGCPEAGESSCLAPREEAQGSDMAMVT